MSRRSAVHITRRPVKLPGTYVTQYSIHRPHRRTGGEKLPDEVPHGQGEGGHVVAVADRARCPVARTHSTTM